jgi:hypothetical protein
LIRALRSTPLDDMPAPNPEQRAATRVCPARSLVMFQTWSTQKHLYSSITVSPIQSGLPITQ